MRTKSYLPICSIVVGLMLAAPGLAQEPGPSTRPAADPVGVYARGDYAGVVRLLAPVHRAGKANIQQRLILARAQLHLGKASVALLTLKSVLAADKENPEANRLTGRVLSEQGKHKDALGFLEKAHKLKADPATASLLGRCYYALGRPVKAKARLEEALAADIRDPANSLLLGKICLARGFGALAEKYLLMAAEAGLDTKELHELLARAYLAQRKYVGPVLLRRLNVAARPGQIVGDVVAIARVEGVSGQYKVATRYSALHEGAWLLAHDADSTEAHFILATSWLAAGKPAQAQPHVSALTKAEPAGRRAVELNARLLLAKKDYPALGEALAAAEAGKTFDAREAADYYYRAAVARRAAGDRAGAVAMLAAAEKRTPTDGRILRSLATLHRAEGKTALARGYYARLVELLPDAPDIDELRNTLRVLGEKKGGA